jgi:hypothetical protein
MTEISFAASWRPAPKPALSPFFGRSIQIVFAASALVLALPAGAQKQAAPVLMDAMTAELHRAFTSLGKQGDDKQLPPYFLSYAVADASAVSIRAQYGALADSSVNHVRVADVQVRLGDPKLDNTHGTHRASAVTTLQLPLTDDREALGRTLWLATNTGYGKALDNFLRVKTEAEVRAKEEDTSPDFSQEAPQTYFGKPAPLVVVDMPAWEKRVSALSKVFREFPDVYQNMVMLTVQNETDYFASSEGSRVVAPHLQARLVVFAMTRADDGMDLYRAQTFEAETVDGLPGGSPQSSRDSAFRRAGHSVGACSGCLLPRGARTPA